MRLLNPDKGYDHIRSFKCQPPAFCNIGIDALDKWSSNKKKIALIYEDPDGIITQFTFNKIRELSNQLANGLVKLGVNRGDRVAILLGQRPETAISHMASFRMGAISLPLFTLFGPDALEYRLNNSGAKIIITDSTNLHKVIEIRDRLSWLEHIIIIDDNGCGEIYFWHLVEQASASFTPIVTAADDPAILIYTSGTTGPPKGALHAHRTMWGHFAAIEFTHDFFPQEYDLFWTPADWAWAGGLFDALFPSWHYGIPVLAHRAAKFDPEKAFDLMVKHKIRNSFLPPTALKMMRQVNLAKSRYAFSMRSIASGGESLGEELIGWGKQTFGFLINEFWGQTECNLQTGNCGALGLHKAGSLGVSTPGHCVAVLDDNLKPLPVGTVGQLACRYPHPVAMLGYWENADATQEKFNSGWVLTGDFGRQDDEGFFWFEGREDDLISSGAYRIGPSEIEDCLMKHPAVAMATVIGAPDPIRGSIVKAFIVTGDAVEENESLRETLQEHVRKRLSAHQYPRAIEFLTELPMTATGKVRRRDLREKENKLT